MILCNYDFTVKTSNNYFWTGLSAPSRALPARPRRGDIIAKIWKFRNSARIIESRNQNYLSNKTPLWSLFNNIFKVWTKKNPELHRPTPAPKRFQPFFLVQLWIYYCNRLHRSYWSIHNLNTRDIHMYVMARHISCTFSSGINKVLIPSLS